MDIWILLITYAVCTYISGYFAPDYKEDKNFLVPFLRPIYNTNEDIWFQKQRHYEGLEVTFSEFIVAGLALSYGVFLLPIYNNLEPQYKILWRLTLHSLYWEILVKSLTRQILIRKAGEQLNVLHSLLMVHGMSTCYFNLLKIIFY